MRQPEDSHRHLITGRTGGGKSHEMLHCLSQRSFDVMPWVVIDSKGEAPVSTIPVSAPATLEDGPPLLPGLYVVRAEIEDHDKSGPLSEYFLEVYRRGNVGVVIDEGQMVGARNRGLRLLLTQGRAKTCPLIILTQRPVYVDRFILSESEFVQVFWTQLRDDQDTIHGIVPRELLDFDKLRDAGLYHSAYYDMRANELEILGPAPPLDEIYDRMLTRLPVYVEPEELPIPRRARL